MYLQEAILDFRKENGVKEKFNWDNQLSQNCLLHNLAMSKQRNIFHAIPEYLQGNAEVVCMGSWIDSERDTVRSLIFTCIAQSEEHKNILLFSSTLGGSYFVSDGIIFITIRGNK